MALPFLPHCLRSLASWGTNRAPSERTRLHQTTVAWKRGVSTEKVELYQQAIRTNNDIEGWHNALIRRASGQCGLPLYSLMQLLDREARLTPATIRLVLDKKLKWVQWKQYPNLQARPFNSWEKFERKEKTAALLLTTCSHLKGSSRRNWRSH